MYTTGVTAISGCADRTPPSDPAMNTVYLMNCAAANDASTRIYAELFLAIRGLKTALCTARANMAAVRKDASSIIGMLFGTTWERTRLVYAPIVRNSACAKFGSLTTDRVSVRPIDIMRKIPLSKTERSIEPGSQLNTRSALWLSCVQCELVCSTVVLSDHSEVIALTQLHAFLDVVVGDGLIAVLVKEYACSRCTEVVVGH